jgi:peptidyl-tRNA hydrolase, PTH1 family
MNPGEKYVFTRHNAGAMALDTMFPEARFSAAKAIFAATAHAEFNGNLFELIKPQTFMNLSGNCVGAALRKWNINPRHLLVLHDEVELEPGEVRYKFGGGHKGHNGLRSIIEVIGTPDFHRVRIGVGRPPTRDAGIADYVLSFQPVAQRAKKESLLAALEMALVSVNNA